MIVIQFCFFEYMMNSSSISKSNVSTTKHDLSYSKYTDDEQDDSADEMEKINEKQLLFNKYLQDGLHAFSTNDLKPLIPQLNNAITIFEQDPKDYDKAVLLKCNLGIVHYYNNEFTTAHKLLEEAFKTLESRNVRPPHLMNENIQTLYIKLCCNLITINIVKGNIEASRDYHVKLNALLINAPEARKFMLIKEAIYILYRVLSVIELNESYINGLESLFDGPTLGCFYNLLGINRELAAEYPLALRYFKAAFEIWVRLDEKYYMLLTLKHIVTIYQSLSHHTQEAKEYYQSWNILVSNDPFKGMNLNTLFEDYDKKIKMGKDVTASLKKFEEELKSNPKYAKDFKLLGNDSSIIADEDHLIWRQAVRFRLMKALKGTTKAIYAQKSQTQYLTMAEEQINDALARLDNEKNPMILLKLEKSSYVKDAVAQFKLQTYKIVNCVNQFIYGGAFRRLHEHALKKNRLSLDLSKLNNPSSIYFKAQKAIRAGSNVTKVHFHSSGSTKKFIKVMPDGNFKWAKNQSRLSNQKTSRQYHLKYILGIMYGKCTKSFLRKGARKYEPWLCFSIILHKRPLDLYCTEEDIDHWIIGLSAEIKKHNPKARIFTLGKYLWYKMNYLMKKLVEIEYTGDKNKLKRDFTLVKAVILYSEIMKKKAKNIKQELIINAPPPTFNIIFIYLLGYTVTDVQPRFFFLLETSSIDQ